MSKNIFNQATFLLSAVSLQQLPPDSGKEIAFAGRSNAGKSSALNRITQINGLARTSKTPGRTQAINVFELDDETRLMDLPGYGYAKVPIAVKERWQKTLEKYLEIRECLTGLVLLMDIRHPLKDLDKMMLDWAYVSKLPVHVLLTKADKFKHGAAKSILLKTREALEPYADSTSIQLFSALKNTGVEEARKHLAKWLV